VADSVVDVEKEGEVGEVHDEGGAKMKIRNGCLSPSLVAL
jgi:hypothetical protein